MSRNQGLRIAFVLPRFGPNIVGGAELLGSHLAQQLANAGHHVEIITTCALDHFTWRNVLKPGTELWGRITVRRFRADERNTAAFADIEHAIISGYSIGKSEELTWLRNGVSSTPMEEHIASNAGSYDLLIAMPYLFGTTYFCFSEAPTKTVLIPCLHDEPYSRLSVVREMLTGARGLMFNSPPEADLARSLAGTIAPNTDVGMGFDPDPEVEHKGFMRRHKLFPPLLLYVGRREGGKNTPLLANYFHRYQEQHRGDVSLLFVGGGDPAPRGPGFAEIPKFDWKERPSLYRAADVFCHPSVNESFSIVLMQSWLAGRPAIVHGDCAVTRYHCEASNGGLWFTNYAEFEKVLDLLLDNRDLRDALGRNGKRYVLEHYSWEAVLRRFHTAAYRWVEQSPIIPTRA